MMLPLAHRVAERGWHIQLHAPADVLLALKPLIEKIPNRIVIDHYFRLPQPNPLTHPAWRFAWELINKGNCWVKLSALYHQSNVADVGDMSAVMQAFYPKPQNACCMAVTGRTRISFQQTKPCRMMRLF